MTEGERPAHTGRHPLPKGWRACTLDDIRADEPGAIAGGPFGSDLTRSDYRDDGVPVIRGGNLGAGDYRRFVADEFVFVSPEKADTLARNTARPGDVLFTQRGTLGQVGLVPPDGELPWNRYIISQSQMKLTCDPAKADPAYVYYACRSPRAHDFIHRHTITTGVPHINLGILRAMPILLPPLAQQRSIARALGALDARIAVAVAMCETLDALARSLFRCWFIDFEPTRVNARADGGRHPTTDELTARLFGSELVDVPLGPEFDYRLTAPRGWERSSIRTFAGYQNGAAFGPADFSPGREGLPVIKISELKRGINDKTRFSEDGHKGKVGINTGDILFAWSGTPQTSIGTHLWSGGPAWLNQHIHRVDPHNPGDAAFVYCTLRSLHSRFVRIARNNQTTGLGHVRKADLSRIPVALPPRRLLERFQQRVGPMLARMVHSRRLAQSLHATRESLLPRLVGGTLRV